MYRIDNATASTTEPIPAVVGPKPDGFFTKGDPGGGTPATIVDDDWANAVQGEICHVIESAGLVLNKTDRTQLKQAISIMLNGADAIARFTTTANINLNGLGTQAGGDWATALTAGDIIFVKNQAAPAANGWYAAAAGAWTRVKWLDESAEVKPSMLTKVSEGATLADTIWMLTTDGPIVLGTTGLVFARKDNVGVQLSDFTGSNQTLSTNGYQKLPGGFILQWGVSASIAGDNQTTVTFPIAFPNACLVVNATATAVAGGIDNFALVISKSTTQTVLGRGYASVGSNESNTIQWMAIGD